jgi:hypothetical protein
MAEVLGKSGAELRSLRAKSRAKISVPRESSASGLPTVLLMGTVSQVGRAKALLGNIFREPTAVVDVMDDTLRGNVPPPEAQAIFSNGNAHIVGCRDVLFAWIRGARATSRWSK